MRLLRSNIGVKGDDLHFESQGPSCHFCADLSQSDDAQNLVAYLDAQETALFPFASLSATIGRRYLSGQGHQHGDSVFRRGDNIARRRIDDHDSLPRGCLYINIINANPSTTHNLQPHCSRQNIACHLCFAAYDQGMIFPYNGPELFRFKAWPFVNLSLWQLGV